MSVNTTLPNSMALSSENQDSKFVTILGVLFFVYLMIGVVVPSLERVEIPREIKEQVPAQLQKIILKEKKTPPVEKKKPEPEKKEPEKEEPKPEKEKPKEPPKTKREAAKQKAQTSGLAALKDELFSMREAVDVKPAASTKLAKGDSKQRKVKRKLLAAQANSQSKGIQAAQATTTVVSDELSTRNTQQIVLTEEEVELSGEDQSLEQETVYEGQRSEVALRRTLEANKSSLYALYNRALRKDPTLKGKVLFEIEIQPSGAISKVTIKSSELGDAKLERRLTLRLKSINFGPDDVDTMTTIWAIEFLPS